MAFYVGQRVVCVEDDAFEGDRVKRLRTGAVYTIQRFAHPREVARARPHPRLGFDLPCVHLVEINRPCGTPYATVRFRPVVEREYDISIFTAMLNPSKTEVEA